MVVVEVGQLLLVVQQRSQRLLGVSGRQLPDATVERQLAVDPVQRAGADLQVEIGAVFGNQLTQRILDFEHGPRIGIRGPA